MSSLEAKIVVVGSQGVGKTSLVTSYCKGSFNPSQITSTVGASFLTKRVVDSDTDTVVRLQIWDTGKKDISSTKEDIVSLVYLRYGWLTSATSPKKRRPGTVPVYLEALLPRRQRLHSLLQHHGRAIVRRDGHLADGAPAQPAGRHHTARGKHQGRHRGPRPH